MNQQERYAKTTEIISQFKNGKELYQTNALFNRCVQSMVRGATPIEIIEQLITVTDDTSKAFEQFIIRSNGQHIINP